MAATPVYSADILDVGSETSPGPSVFWMDRFEQWVDLNYYAVLLRGGGRTILLNTGLPEDFSRYRQFVHDWHPRATVTRTSEQELLPSLARLGVTPDQVDTVIFTPLTVYTAGGLHWFKKARYVLSRRTWVDYWAPDRFDLQLPRDIILPDESLACLAGEGRARITLLEEDEGDIAPGLRYFRTGGHHNSSIAYVAETSLGSVAFADCCFTYENVERNVPIGLAESLHECFAAYHRLRTEASIVVPLYDPEVLIRHPGGRIA